MDEFRVDGPAQDRIYKLGYRRHSANDKVVTYGRSEVIGRAIRDPLDGNFIHRHLISCTWHVYKSAPRPDFARNQTEPTSQPHSLVARRAYVIVSKQLQADYLP
jgi:hypothetical protein